MAGNGQDVRFLLLPGHVRLFRLFWNVFELKLYD